MGIMENVSPREEDSDILIIENDDHADKDDALEKNGTYEKFEKAIEANTQTVTKEQSNLSIKPSALKKFKERKESLKCSECGKSMSDQNNLQMHMFYKHKQKTYACDMCDYKAPRESKLKFHKKIIH